jgi:hypothetical protein
MSFSNYETKPVFDLFPYWAGKFEDAYVRPIDRIEGIGRTYGKSFADYPRYETNGTIVCNGKAAIDEVNVLFDSTVGRRGALWFPSWREDIKLTADIAADSIYIEVEEYDGYLHYPATPGSGRYILIYLNRSTWYVRKITDYPWLGYIAIDSQLGVAITMAEVKMFCFLYYGRFDIDEIEWEYVSPDVAISELYFIECPKEYPS